MSLIVCHSRLKHSFRHGVSGNLKGIAIAGGWDKGGGGGSMELQ